MTHTITTCSACPWVYSVEPHGPIVALLEHWQRTHWQRTHWPAVTAVLEPVEGAA